MGQGDDAMIEQLRGRGARDPADRLLPPAGPSAAACNPGRCVLAPLRRHRERGGDQGRAVQPLPHARRRARPWWRPAPQDRIALYTGNDDHIVLDLVTTVSANARRPARHRALRGGLLGHWSVWTSQGRRAAAPLPGRRGAQRWRHRCRALLALDSASPTCNAAFFDVANDFHGCIAGCHEVLRRQGLLEGTWCLDPRRA
jgi:hypothetical protein